MAQYPLRATEARLQEALAGAKRDLLQLDSHEWTQGNQDHFDTVVKNAMRRDVWHSIDDMSTYVFAMFHRVNPHEWAPPRC